MRASRGSEVVASLAQAKTRAFCFAPNVLMTFLPDFAGRSLTKFSLNRWKIRFILGILIAQYRRGCRSQDGTFKRDAFVESCLRGNDNGKFSQTATPNGRISQPIAVLNRRCLTAYRSNFEPPTLDIIFPIISL